MSGNLSLFFEEENMYFPKLVASHEGNCLFRLNQRIQIYVNMLLVFIE